MDASEFGKCTQDLGPGTAMIRALLIPLTDSLFGWWHRLIMTTHFSYNLGGLACFDCVTKPSCKITV